MSINAQDIIQEMLSELQIKFGWDGRYYITDILLYMNNTPEKKTNTQLYKHVCNLHPGITEDAVERNVRYAFSKMNLSSPLAHKLFGGSPVTNKQGLFTLLYELQQRLK